MLVTHPDFRRQGAASILIQWGCDLADRNGVAAYLDAHEDAAPLYRKFGFKDRNDIGVTSDGAVPMIREPQKRG
jgi:GNAT superfamily N-acetyltransferase